MGHMLPKPIVDKDSDCCPPSGALGLLWASSCMQGWRTGMEDAHVCIPDLGIFQQPGLSQQSLARKQRWQGIAFFGVMDGHGGEQVAKYAKIHLTEELLASELSSESSSAPSCDEIRDSLIRSFHQVDEMLHDRSRSAAELQALTNAPLPGTVARQQSRVVDADNVGCTCVTACITDRHIITANAGDSRAVLCRNGRAVALSEDHKPNAPGEKARIIAAGGYLEQQGGANGAMYRVNGNLNLSRALGDLEYKKDRRRGPEAQIISGTPDVEVFDRTDQDEFILICCDGVWDVKTNQEAVDFVRDRMPPSGQVGAEGKIQEILEQLLDRCLSPNLQTTRGLGGDNMTAVLVRFPPARKDEASAPRLLAASLNMSTTQSGTLSVRVKLPTDCEVDAVLFDVSFETAALEVQMIHGCSAARIPLIEHLPKGARLLQTEAIAKFHRKTRTVRIRLPWSSA